jgi:outer membrane autotransporter protein
LSAPQARQAFDALSGEIHASAETVMIDDSRYLRQAVLSRLRQASYAGAGAGGAFAALGTGGPMVAYADSDLMDSDFSLAYAKAKPRPSFPLKALPHAAPDAGFTFWTQAVGAWGRIDGDGNAADVRRDLGGFFSGVDRRLGDWRVGVAGGFTNSRVSVDARASSANIDTAHFAAYAATSRDAWNFRSGAGFTWSALDTSRMIAFPGFFDQASASYHADTGQVFGEVGYGMSLGAVAAEPFAGLAFVHLDGGSFAEAGGVAALAGSGNSEDIGYSSLGVRAAANYPLMNGMMLTPRASAAWQHAFSAVTPTASLAFQSTGAGFTVAGVPIARDAALVDAGFDVRVTPRASVGVAYSGQLAGHAQDNAVKGNLAWSF